MRRDVSETIERFRECQKAHEGDYLPAVVPPSLPITSQRDGERRGWLARLFRSAEEKVEDKTICSLLAIRRDALEREATLRTAAEVFEYERKLNLALEIRRLQDEGNAVIAQVLDYERLLEFIEEITDPMLKEVTRVRLQKLYAHNGNRQNA